MEFIMQPQNPEWPEKALVNFPSIMLLPMINRDDPWIKRVWTVLTKRPSYLITTEYFTYIDEVDGWFWCPPNFVYDMASIPKGVPVLNPAGVFAYPALPHDFAYRFGGLLLSREPGAPFEFFNVSRIEADAIFKVMGKRANGLYVLDCTATVLLRLFAGLTYHPRDIYQEDWSKPVY